MPAAVAAASSSSSSSSASNWLSTWRKSLACRTQANEVHDPRHRQQNPKFQQAAAQDMAPDLLPPATGAALLVNQAASIAASGSGSGSGGGSSSMRRFHIGGAGQGHYLRSGCSRSIANLKDVIHSSRRMDILSSNHHHGRDSGIGGGMANFSPKSVESSDFVQSISREAMFKDHGDLCEHIIRPFGQGSKLSVDDIVANHNYHSKSSSGSNGSSVLKTGTSGSGHFYGTPLHSSAQYGGGGGGASSTASSTPLHYYSSSSTKSTSSHGNSLMKLSGCYDCKNPAVSLVVYKSNGSLGPTASTTGRGCSSNQHHQVITTPICRRCNEVFSKYEALEKHHLLKHAVTELSMGDSSRNVVEIIFRTSWMTAAATGGRKDMQVLQVTGAVKIERVLKVNNLPRTLARFEAYRDGVKMKAGKLIPKKHPRCLADGNELLRFYAAKLECGLVSSIEAASNPSGEYKTNDMNAASRSGTPPSSLPFGAACSSPTCSICRIIRSGFSKSRAPDGSNRGILTTATSGRAHDILQQKMTSSGESLSNNNYGTGRNLMAMLVCRVIAGRVQKPAASGVLDTVGFDSVAGGDTSVASTSSSHYSLTEAAAVGLHSRFEELTVFSPRAILPCFVVLYSCAANKP